MSRAGGATYTVVRDDIQGGVLEGYNYNVAAYLFVSVRDAEIGRRWLGSLVGGVQTAHRWADKPLSTLNIAVSATGLAALGLPEEARATFAPEFLQGMRARAERLGDVGVSAPENWDRGFRDGDGHVLLIVQATDLNALNARVDLIRELLESYDDALSLVHEQPATSLNTQREHFGFGDGFAQPAFECGLTDTPYRGLGVPEAHGGWRRLKTGEVLLGHDDEDGVLPAAPIAPFGYNSTYMVYRKLYQDVSLFRRTLTAAAEGYPGGAERLAAKVVGRWPDGTPLTLAPHGPDERLSGENDFRYADDPDGYRCPLGAHIRRANPRDALGHDGLLTKRHRIVRRGMPYGPELPPDAPDDGQDRGLVFVCFAAHIARQFETIQTQWLNDGNAFGLGDDTDYLMGGPQSTGKMTVHGDPPFFLAPRGPFVQCKGGEYLFLPSVTALRALTRSEPEW